jgi:hypothetical protein
MTTEQAKLTTPVDHLSILSSIGLGYVYIQAAFMTGFIVRVTGKCLLTLPRHGIPRITKNGHRYIIFPCPSSEDAVFLVRYFRTFANSGPILASDIAELAKLSHLSMIHERCSKGHV